MAYYKYAGAGGGGASLPTQTGNSGKYLTTNGTAASWAAVSSAPTPANRATLNPVAAKTANYTILNTDYYVSADGTGGAFALTLPASPFAGQELMLERIDFTLANVVSITGTIEGATNWTLNTPGEVYHLFYTGSVWKILNHITNYAWANTTTTIGAVTTAPTPGNIGDGGDTQSIYRDGAYLMAELDYLRGTGASGSNAGAGFYEWVLPSGIVVDTTKIPTGIRNYGGFAGTVGDWVLCDTATNPRLGKIYVLTTNKVRFSIQASSVAQNIWGTASDGSAVWTNAGAAFSIRMRIPIQGWKD